MSDIFKDLNLTDDEKEFVKNIKQDLGPTGDMQVSLKGIALSTLYLGKQIEVSSKSNDRSSKRMFWLTAAIVFFGACQVVVAVISLLDT